MIRHIVLPAAAGADRAAAEPGVAWLALVVAEQVNANAGLGFRSARPRSSCATT
jgi:sulfonate transport system permease protein